MQIISQGEEKLKQKEIITNCKRCNCIFSYKNREIEKDTFRGKRYVRCPWCGCVVTIEE